MPLGPLLVFGNDQPANPGASVLTLYCNDGIVAGANAGTLQTTVPPASTSTTGWTVGTVASGNFSRQSYNNEVATTGFGSTTQPSSGPLNSAQDCWRYGPSTGTFSGGTWYSTLSVIAVTSGGDQDGRVRVRLWRSHNADGTVATELNGPQVGSKITDLAITVAQSSSVSIFVPVFAITNEYLFFQAAWEITGAGTAADRDVLVRYGGGLSTVAGSGLVTAPFGTGGGAATPTKSPYYLQYYQRHVADDA